jgi:hypothetical protein
MVALGMTLTVGACGVYGPTGNDTGGIIPWSPAAELTAMETAQADAAATTSARSSRR